MVDWGSGYQLVDLLPNRERSAAKVWTSFCRTWIRYFSCPSVVITDQGNEFAGVFSMSLGQLGCMHHTTDSKSPWQNGRCERAGGEYKRQLRMACTEAGVSSSDEYHALCHVVVSVRNRQCNRGGFSPIQRVLGYQPELPQSLIEDDKAAM
eukprot:993167-Amphidinium_carterae.1